MKTIYVLAFLALGVAATAELQEGVLGGGATSDLKNKVPGDFISGVRGKRAAGVGDLSDVSKGAGLTSNSLGGLRGKRAAGVGDLSDLSKATGLKSDMIGVARG